MSGAELGREDPPTAIDTTVAHPARMYNYLLGGEANFEVDRATAQRAAAVHPDGLLAAQASARSNQAFLVRAVRWLAREVGVRQYLDLGAGIPNGIKVHSVVQQAAAGTQVVYVDNDPIVLAHAHQFLSRAGGDDQVTYVHGDPLSAASILEAARNLDISRPVALLLVGVLHFVPDDGPLKLVTELLNAVPTESHVVVCHPARDIHPSEMAEVERRFNESTAASWQFRSRDEVRHLFSGMDIVEPGVVQVDEWRPDDESRAACPVRGRANPLWAGVGRKP